eukprot:2628298-Karenia_brevis.AAC.1
MCADIGTRRQMNRQTLQLTSKPLSGGLRRERVIALRIHACLLPLMGPFGPPATRVGLGGTYGFRVMLVSARWLHADMPTLASSQALQQRSQH